MSGLYYNFFQRNRSELLADYLLSSIGIATPVRRQFDHGIDFYCNLIKDNDSGFLTFGYPFAIQIKSASTSEIIYGKNKKKWRPENISWLFQNELPFFIGVVDKKYSSIEIYDTTGIWQLYLKDEKNFSQVILKPGKRGKHEWRGNVDKIELPNWDTTKGDSHKHIIDLGNPIINITLEDLNEKQVLQNKKGILSRVIKIEQENIIRRNLGIKCFKEIKSNAKNESHCEWGMNFPQISFNFSINQSTSS